MRKIVYSLSISLDGFFEGENGEIDWNLVDRELHAHFNERFSGMSAFLSGRVTHDLMAEFWPTADQDPDIEPEMAEFATIWRDMPKYCFSTTATRTDWKTTTRHEVNVDEINDLKNQPGGDMVVGGPNLAATFRELNLIDEYTIYVHPVLLGKGRPPFRNRETLTALDHVETRTFGNGVTLLHYRRTT